jgi:hypothetical protein
VPLSHSDAVRAFELYNETAQKVGIPKAATLSPQRRRGILARLRDHGGLEAWKTALANIERTPFLRGDNDRGWTADLDFLLKASRFTKVLEGGYERSAFKPAPRYAGQRVF